LEILTTLGHCQGAQQPKSNEQGNFFHPDHTH
jgi:hypothetical protein